jgi:hypothetical protein
MQIEANSPNLPDFLFGDLRLEWLMTRWEKYALHSLLQWLRPANSLEIGTYRGGSLQMIARHSARVISVDLLEEPRQTLSNHFNNVDFRVGDSSVLVPQVISELQVSPEALNFVLIDGDHSTEGVKRDIESVLKYRPKGQLFIVMHDSFHPPCREGMLQANWTANPFVHYVELDFVPGVYFRDGFGTVRPGSMYGGFGLARLEATERTHDLVIGQVQSGLFESTKESSDALRREAGSPIAPRSENLWHSLKRALRPRSRLRRFFTGDTNVPR